VIELLNSNSLRPSDTSLYEGGLQGKVPPSRGGENYKEKEGGVYDFTDYALSGDLIATCFG